MQFTTILFALLPMLVTAHPQGSPNPPPLPGLTPFSNNLCVNPARARCPKSNDGGRRCLEIDGTPLCAFVCEKESTCPTECQKQGHKNGRCTTGDNPCICSDVDGGDDAPPQSSTTSILVIITPTPTPTPTNIP
ncbi:hypothetical protein LZ30DRAFT_649610 [Colletotrichum cereale]|nr:hypothetical protein LZ30DRAFT_649610 [Colletotrichum cereale]